MCLEVVVMLMAEAVAEDTVDAGSTASTAILLGDRLLVANVGDSRAVIIVPDNVFRSFRYRYRMRVKDFTFLSKMVLVMI